MLVVPIVAAAVTATIAVSSAANMFQIYSIARNDPLFPSACPVGSEQADDVGGAQRDSRSFDGRGSVLDYITADGSAMAPVTRSQKDVLSDLRKMSREELVALFLACDAPSNLEYLLGEWDGHLLDNNGWVLTSITSFLTNTLFGMGRRWNGKEFLSLDERVGTNRFSRNDGASVEKEHKFEFALGKSRIQQKGQSVVLQYRRYQHPLSLWRTMVDEVRFLPLQSSGGEKGILIGMGCMQWSGGAYNSSPFCLVPKK